MMPQKAPHSSSPESRVPSFLARPAPPAMLSGTGLCCFCGGQVGKSQPSLSTQSLILHVTNHLDKGQPGPYSIPYPLGSSPH